MLSREVAEASAQEANFLSMLPNIEFSVRWGRILHWTGCEGFEGSGMVLPGPYLF